LKVTVLREDGFEQFLKRQMEAMNGVLVHGSDSAALAGFGRQIVRAIVGANGEAERYDASILKEGAGRIQDEFYSLSLLGDRRVLWIDDVGDGNLKSLAEIITSTQLANFVFLSSDSLAKTSKLRIACEEAAKFGSLALYEEDIASVRTRLGSLISKADLRWEDGAEDLFLDIVGTDRSVVTQEFEKLTLYCFGGTIISGADILAVCGDTASSSSDSLIDSMLMGDLETVDRMYGNLDSGTGGPKMILSSTISHLVRLQELRGIMDTGMNADSAVRGARPPIFFKRQSAVISQLKKFDAPELMWMQQSLAAATFQARKNADLADAVTSRALLSLARLARSKSTNLSG
jgi:DNA polymerase III subunit delta